MTSTTTLQGPYVFLSYPRFEEAFTKRLEQDLRAHNLQVWRDESNINPGSPDWEAAIRDAISHAYAVVLIASPSVIKSQYIKGELNLAKRYHPKRIYPVWIDGTEWSDCVPIDFINTQYIDMRGEKYALGLNALTKVLKKAKEQPLNLPQDTTVHQQGALPPYPPYAQLQGSRQEGLSSPSPPLPVPQGQKPPRRFPAGITLLLSILVVLLVGGTLYYTAVYQPNRPPVPASTIDFSNFTFEVQMRILKGDGGGIIFRAAKQVADKFYDFVISPDGNYWTVRANVSSFQGLGQSGFSSAIKQGINQTNVIAVVAQGSSIDLYVNHRKVDSANDSTFSHGGVGFIAGINGNGNPTEVVFSNAKVWTL